MQLGCLADNKGESTKHHFIFWVVTGEQLLFCMMPHPFLHFLLLFLIHLIEEPYRNRHGCVCGFFFYGLEKYSL
ncbi:hypothetical protein GDO81_014876 [Engystomops pustulosus]|uniref:Uncharacterized protein n=1 Tax=Engystomops pustulosus TaxID=76066 RepID=A0AAV7AHJ9_ENGPU|nr:hypothetical protein GDO81_014876 [Engystomops pustulosus]